jgi:hypothetical protein
MLRDLRVRHRETLLQIAALLGLGKAHGSVSLIERGEQALTMRDVIRLKEHWSLSDEDAIRLVRWAAEQPAGGRKRRTSSAANREHATRGPDRDAPMAAK